MHYNVLVILEPTSNIRDRVDAQLRPFKLDWDDEVSCRTAKWDWCSLPPDGPFTDPEVVGLVGDFKPLNRACRISQLPPDYSVAAAITPDGAWHGLEDFGWRLIDEPCQRNDDALAKWQSHFREIVARHQHAIGVEVHCHG